MERRLFITTLTACLSQGTTEVTLACSPRSPALSFSPAGRLREEYSGSHTPISTTTRVHFGKSARMVRILARFRAGGVIRAGNAGDGGPRMESTSSFRTFGMAVGNFGLGR